MNKYAKFAVLITIVLGTLIWLATAGISGSQTYYKTISELNQMGNRAQETKVRVGGDIEKGSIVRKNDLVEFTLTQEARKLKVAYTGKDPLPDTFRDGAQALADGKLGTDGVFRSTHIQAKCASKYAPKPGQAPPGLKAVPARTASL